METMKRFCALLLSVVMSASLCAPAAAAEVGDMVPVCGMEEHVHTGDCRSGDPLEDLISGSGAVKGETVYVVHQHGSGCYDGEGNLACVLMDEGHMSRYPDVVIVHKHDRNCTDCTLPESSYEVTDGMESVDSDSVYDHDSPHYVVGVPGDAHEGVNGVPEDMYLGYHTHGDGCDEGCTLPVVVEYVANGSGAYFCGKAEHVHADACFRKDSLDGDAKASDTKAIPLIDYGGDTYGSASEALGAAGRRVDPYLFGSEEDSVVAISCAFRNFSGSGGTGASLSVKPGAVSADESEYDSMASVELSTEDSVSEYNYALKYETVDDVSENVVLWCNVEGYDRDSSSEWFGKIVGYDVGSTGAQVYVNDMAIVPEDYVTTASSNGKDYTWLTTPGSGWRKADGNWDSVKSVAFWFSGKKFDVNANPSATVYLKMIAPSSIETNSDQSVYTAYNEIFFSDEHKGTGAKGTVLTNSASVDIMLTGPNVPFGNEMPKTGGAGTVLFLLCGAACLVVAGVAYGARRRGDDEQGG